MPLTTAPHAWPHAADTAACRSFAREVGIDADGAPMLEWRLARNCSLAPRQLGAGLGGAALLALAIAAVFWDAGAKFVLPFASIELAALALALVVYARHAGDRDRVVLGDGRLAVERIDGLRTEHVEFDAAWVRVEPEHTDSSLIALSGQGRRVAIGRFVRPELRGLLARELRSEILQRRTSVRNRDSL